MATTPRSQNHLAELLGISKGAVSKLAGRGMPTHTVEAARAWRKAHLNPASVKGARFDKYYKPGPSRQLLHQPVQTAPERPWFEIAAALLGVACDVLQAGQSIKAMVPTLRAALCCVPMNERPDLLLPLDVVNVLVADVLALLPCKEREPIIEDGSPAWCNGANMTEHEAAEMGAFWYRVAAGELSVQCSGTP